MRWTHLVAFAVFMAASAPSQDPARVLVLDLSESSAAQSPAWLNDWPGLQSGAGLQGWLGSLAANTRFEKGTIRTLGSGEFAAVLAFGNVRGLEDVLGPYVARGGGLVVSSPGSASSLLFGSGAGAVSKELDGEATLRAGDHPAAGRLGVPAAEPGTRAWPQAALAAGTTVLLGHGDDAVSWCRSHGKGRVAVCGLGTFFRRDPAGLSHLLDALAWVVRAGPGRPKAAATLFDGTDLSAFVAERGGDMGWKVSAGVLEIVPGSGSIMTRESFEDFQLHLEFRVPPGVGNSGVYIQRRYEVQILQSHGKAPKPSHCGALYRYRAPVVNAALPAGEWQTYDIVFRAPRWGEDGKKTTSARITVIHNGIAVHRNAELTRKTGAGKKEAPNPGPILFQDHGNPIAFRNIWIRRLDSASVKQLL